MRRVAFPLAILAALIAASDAAGAFQPIHRTIGELTLPRMRAGTIKVPAEHESGRVRVIARLPDAPLAAVFSGGTKTGSATRLNVSSSSSRAYLARLAAVQQRDATALERAIPSAHVSRRFRIVLDGLTVNLPAKRLPALLALPFVTHVYPSLTYTVATNQSPAIIQADVLHHRTGALGQGVKIGVVDTGIDETNPFLRPDGMQYPPGFPRGARRWTTPKVIVAKTFPGPGSGRAGRIPLDVSDPHGTHVSGIAAGRAGTYAPPGRDHPGTDGLSGVAPDAWLGNYRVFTVPTPVGNVANTPEIIAAFEAAVRDGMDVINFSGGGPETDPANDALIPAVANVAAAGVVPVIAAGNDRDDFGLGTAGSPGSAPAAISVAATTNNHVFSPMLTLDSPKVPGGPSSISFFPGLGPSIPSSWANDDQTIVDVSTLIGRDATPVNRYLCGPSNDPNGSGNPLQAGSLVGSIALVWRGGCTFTSKADRVKAAGGIGMLLINNRAGDASTIPIDTAVPSGMISDLDGARMHAALAGSAGRGLIRIDSDIHELQTDRGGIVAYFSSAGPTDFTHQLKPDISAPGTDILSSITKAFDSSQFTVFEGTSMATPHIAGAAALLVQLHPNWSPQQVKSALMATAGAAWNDTARTTEAQVTLEGAGLANVDAAADPKVLPDPASLSFGDLNVSGGPAHEGKLVLISDVGSGSGTWQVELESQSATAGANLQLPGSVDVAPGATATVPIVATASKGAATGDDYGFVVLRRGDVTRRIPYLFLVTRPGLASAPVKRLHVWQTGSTRTGLSRASVYRFPQWAFGPPPTYTGSPMNEGGAEKVYTTLVRSPLVNVGVAVIAQSAGAFIDPWFLGSLDENDVQGYAGTPVNVNGLMFDYRADLGVSGVEFPRMQQYYVSVDSGRDPYTGGQHPGAYRLKMWRNDLTPPSVRLVTRRVTAGRPMLVARVLDKQSGIDPLSLVIGYRRVLVGAAAYDPGSGLVLFPLPRQAPTLRGRSVNAILVASDNQETKNIATIGANPMPNTRFRGVSIRTVRGPAASWLAPAPGRCVRPPRVRLAVTATSSARIRSVHFYDGKKSIRTVRKGTAGLYFTDWTVRAPDHSRHVLRATVRDRKGRTFTAVRVTRVCR